MKFQWNWYWLNVWLFIWIISGALVFQILKLSQNIDWALLGIIIYLYSFRQWEIVHDESRDYAKEQSNETEEES